MSYRKKETPVNGVDIVFLDHIKDTFDYNGLENLSLLNVDDIPPVSIQRNFEQRAQNPDTVEIFGMDLPSMREYHLQWVPESFKYEIKVDGKFQERIVKKGLYLSNGCTRREVYNLGKDKGGLDVPQNGGAILMITKVDNEDMMRAEYYSHDSSSAVESIANVLCGVLREVKVKLKSSMSRGKFATVLRHAYPGKVSKVTLLDMFSFYKTPALDVDKSNIFDAVFGVFKKAQFRIAAFMFSKLHLDNRNSVVDILDDLANVDKSDTKYNEDRKKEKVTGRTLLIAAATEDNFLKVVMANSFTSIKSDRFPRPTAFFLWALEKELAGKRVKVKDFNGDNPSVDDDVIKEFWVNNTDNYYRKALKHLSNYL